MFNSFSSNSGVAPKFPIAGTDGGSSPLWSEYSFQYYGTSFLIHPDKYYQELPTNGGDYGIDYGFTNDTCTATSTIDFDLKTNKAISASIIGKNILIELSSNENLSMEIFTTNGRLIYSMENLHLSTGTNSVILPSFVSNGIFLLKLRSKTVTLNKKIIIQ